MIIKFSKLLLNPIKTNTIFKFGQSLKNLKREGEAKVAKKLKQCLHPTYLQVTDTTLSGSSCGQMYKITIESPAFEGKSKVVQHQMVSECLTQQLKSIHAFNLKTKIPKKAQQQTTSKAAEPNQNQVKAKQ